ncbi:MAG: ClpX C4-type zinc finger protein [Terriglobales bacterium]
MPPKSHAVKNKLPRRTPPVLDCARVLHYAVLDRSVTFSGRSLLFVGGKELGRVPCLAIAEDKETKGVFLFHCTRKFRVLGCSAHASVREAKHRAETTYPGVAGRWVKSGVTKTKADRFLDGVFKRQRCAVCRKRPDQVQRLVRKSDLLICSDCVRELYEMLAESVAGATEVRKR